MKALSIRQPWAWAILFAGKPVENRSWPTRFRGRFLIHASAGMTNREFEEAILGRLELVRDHYRGNPAIGLKRSRYTVVPPKRGSPPARGRAEPVTP